MLEFLNANPNDALAILKNDHDKVKDLFERFEKAESLGEKKKIVDKVIMELKIHATIEEEIFYPALRKAGGVEKDLLNEADEEHHVAKLLIAELDQMKGREGKEDHYEAKFTVLSENIKHHVKEEENDLFPQARKTAIDFEALGKRLLARKQELKRNGVPPAAEEEMITTWGQADSPAQAARAGKRKTVRLRAGRKGAQKASVRAVRAKGKSKGEKSKAKRKSQTRRTTAKSQARVKRSAQRPARKARTGGRR